MEDIMKNTMKNMESFFTRDLEDWEEIVWSDPNTRFEAVQEAAWDENVDNLIVRIKNSKLSVEEIQGLYTDLGKLIFDNVDNYAFKLAESKK